MAVTVKNLKTSKESHQQESSDIDDPDAIQVVCPVCQTNISPEFINSHLDTCLRSENCVSQSQVGSVANRGDKAGFFSRIMKRPLQETESTQRKSSKIKTLDSPSRSTKSSPCASISNFMSPNKQSSHPKSDKPSPSSNSVATIQSDVMSTAKNAPKIPKFQPLAEQMRPTDFHEFEGQEGVLGPNCMLRKLLECQDVPSMILWGPPGCGKTSLVHVIATSCKAKKSSRFVKMSATTVGVKDVKDAVEIAKSEQNLFKRRTILFLDEIHRFNKLQQDIFLPHVENGTIILIGATTENPSFSLNSALLSRCRVFVMEKLSQENIENILKRALEKSDVSVCADDDTLSDLSMPGGITESALGFLSSFCDGDARSALNGLQMALASKQDPNKDSLHSNAFIINLEDIKESLQRSHVLYDRKGDQHYDIISAYIKSMRGSDVDAALYWLARMLVGGEDPRFVARRLVVFASEDVGMADPNALNLASSTYASCQNVGMPECKLNLSHCTVYMAKAPKSRACCDAYNLAEKSVQEHQGPLPSVPLHLRNAPTRLMKDLGYSKGYKMYAQKGKDLSYLPDGLGKFFKP